MQSWAPPKDALCITPTLAEDKRELTESGETETEWARAHLNHFFSRPGRPEELLVVAVGCGDGVPVCLGVAQPCCSDVPATKGELQGGFLCFQQPWGNLQEAYFQMH